MSNRDMPIFVKIDDYKEVFDVLELIKTKLAQAKNTLEKIDELKEQEDAEIDLWKGNIDEIEERINSIDESLLEPESF